MNFRVVEFAKRNSWALLCTTLFLAAALKVVQFFDQYDFFLIALVGWEFSLAFWIASGIYQQWARILSIGTFFAFFVYSLTRMFGTDVPCNCFGAVSLAPWKMVLINSFCVSAAVLWKIKDTTSRQRNRLRNLIFAINILIVFPLALMVSRVDLVVENNSKDWVTLDYQKWIGREWEVGKYAEIPNELKNGNWTVVMIKLDCKSCIKKLSQLRSTEKNLAVIEIPSSQQLLNTSDTVWILLPKSKKWIVDLPSVFRLSDQIVSEH